MEYYDVLLPLAIILTVSKAFAKICERFKLPAVVGMLIAGLAIGLINYIPGQTVFTDTTVSGIGFIAKIGVILIMFSAGLETNVNQIKAIGLPAVIITIFGVVVPMGLGFVVAVLFNGGFADMTPDRLYTCLFYGVILTATSVSVTVATLKELNKLDSKVGSTIIAAAIIDDIIGVIVLSFILSMQSGNSGEVQSPITVMLLTVMFFVVIIILGFFANKLFKFIERKWPHHRMLPIFSVSLCFLFAYLGEHWFGVADITGAFAAGLILSQNPESEYIDRKSDIMSYMIFTPVFFANIGITTRFSNIDASVVLFGLCFIVAGICGKLFGCMGASLICRYSVRDSLRVGVGMMARAEVALICAQKGIDKGMIDSSIMPFIVILIIISGLATPIILKKSYSQPKQNLKAA
ncbi:MAG: cation:proton antiporter [Clostridiales bacterium]|nr:cation:proton antiporter [Clostridiales bacterium]